MSQYAETSRRLQDALAPVHPPIAVRFCNEAPEGVPAFRQNVAAGCVFWEEATKGPFVTSAADHGLCAIGIYTHNFIPAPDIYQTELTDTLWVMADLEYVRPEDVDGIPVNPRESRFVVYGPLSTVSETPDAVVLFAHSRQGLIISKAVQQVDEDLPPALGRPACALIPQVLRLRLRRTQPWLLRRPCLPRCPDRRHRSVGHAGAQDRALLREDRHLFHRQPDPRPVSRPPQTGGEFRPAPHRA